MMQLNAAARASDQPWFAQLQCAALQAHEAPEPRCFDIRQAAQRMILAAAQHSAEGRLDVAKILCRNAAMLADLAEKLA